MNIAHSILLQLSSKAKCVLHAMFYATVGYFNGVFMKEIPLTQGKVALVDDEDFEKLNNYKWCAANYRGKFYAMRSKRVNNKRTTLFIHTEIMSTPKGLETDHINRDGLDNRKCNLRVCSKKQNARNREILKRNKCGFKGVCWDKTREKWWVRIMVDGKRKILGRYDNIIDAALAYNNGAIKFHGEFAGLNKV